MISVLMPVYNSERTVVKAVQSILDQAHSDFEIVIVDDGSTDQSLAVIESLAKTDDRVRTFSIAHGGIVSALNYGLSKCRGDWIARMDADDVALPERLNIQHDFMILNPNIDLIGCAVYLRDKDGNVVGVDSKPTTPEKVIEYTQWNSPMLHPAFFGKRHVYEVLGGYRDICPAEDLDFLIRAILSGFVVSNIDIPLLYVSTFSDGVSGTRRHEQVRLANYMHETYRKGNSVSLEDCATILQVSKLSQDVFNVVERIRSRLVVRWRGSSGVRKLCVGMSIVFVSVFHPDTLRHSVRAYRGGRVVR